MRPIETILFPTDFSACAESAYRHAAYLADRLGATLHVLHVVEDEAAPERDWPEGTGTLMISAADIAADLGLPEPEADADGVDVPLVETEVVGRDAATAILDLAYDEEVGLIVMGTHGRRGWRRGTLGSVAEAVSRRAPCPVLTVRPDDADRAWPPRRILLALAADAVDTGTLPPAGRWAVRLAAAYGAPLDLVHVASPIAEAIGEDETAEFVLEAMAERLRAEPAGAADVRVHVVTGDAATSLRELALRTHAHLVVVGTHARTGVGRALIGSVAEEVARTAPCPVLIVRDVLAGDGAEFDAARADSHV
ncbi:universal stress protein [Rubrivirga sp. IMCC43871]|uniref:universal stress protein n=1 Tax=Rubrivirga sp. IMCC43871 TaxID=3391575 RepID=UPI003990345D